MRYEKDLANHFLSLLDDPENPWGEVQKLIEFDYTRGRTDVVAKDVEGNIIAFELKLLRWSNAVHQAYRNTCFAHMSYVVLPEAVANRAWRSNATFYERQIGLCGVGANGLNVLIPASHSTPIEPWLSERASRAVDQVSA